MDQTVLGPKDIWIQNSLCHKIFFDLAFFAKNFFWPKIFFHPKIFATPKIFESNFCWPKHLSGLTFFWTPIFFTQIYFDKKKWFHLFWQKKLILFVLTKKFDPHYFLTLNVFEEKSFCTSDCFRHNIFFTKILLDPKLYWTQNSLGLHFFGFLKFFGSKKILWLNYMNQDFFDTKRMQNFEEKKSLNLWYSKFFRSKICLIFSWLRNSDNLK